MPGSVNCSTVEAGDACTIEDFRKIDKEIAATYDGTIRRSGLSATEFWVMLHMREGTTSQCAICREMLASKQTVNSACKQLVRRGFVQMEPAANNNKSKVLVFTEVGRQFATQYMGAVELAEEAVWREFSPEERTLAVEFMRKYNRLLKEQLK